MAYQAELQSSRQKVVLYETAAPIQLEPGERHDFMVKHDIKEISTYTLICSSRYGTGEGAAYQPQYFKFNAANPLSGEKQPFSMALQQVCHVASVAVPRLCPSVWPSRLQAALYQMVLMAGRQAVTVIQGVHQAALTCVYLQMLQCGQR